ncbi:4Fe-4S dicluster domain-containing protein [Magnetococcales bacterium HHB-1]
MNTQRRKLLKGIAGAGALSSIAGLTITADQSAIKDTMAAFFQDHYRRLSTLEIQQALARIERQAKRDYGIKLHCRNTPPQKDVRFGFAIDLSRCKGTRRCVEACVEENNCDRQGSNENIRVLSLPHGEWNLNQSNHHFKPEKVPEENTTYLPIQCQQCNDPPCVQACPVEATWQEQDGMVVVDYNWCIGCRYCAVSCPYGARHFNWRDPVIPKEQINPETHYLGNRPRPRGVMEKCTFCIQRTRLGKLPACQESCPTGARIFGNLLDPQSEIRYVLEHKPVFILKQEQNTHPKFWYYFDV